MEEYEIISNTKGKADIWKLFGVKQHKKDKSILKNVAVCRKCCVEIKYSGGTSNLVAHIRRHHSFSNSPTPDAGSSGASAISSSNVPSCPTQKTLSEMLNKQPSFCPSSAAKPKHVTDAIAKFIVAGLRPYSIVDSKVCLYNIAYRILE